MTATLPTASMPTHLCYTRDNWADAWTETPLLRCDSLNDQAAPAHATAQLHYRYGQAILPEIGSRSADSSKASVAAGSLVGKYVKVTVTGLGSWYGIIVDLNDDRTGEIGTTIPSGVENYTAYGLTLLLEKSSPIRQSVVKTPSGTATIGIAIPFNAGTDGRRDGSRVATGNFDTTAECFSDSELTEAPDFPAKWKASDAIDYLLANFPPKDKSGTAQITFSLVASSALDFELPMMPYDGMNLWDIINKLIPRQRGLGFNATVNGSEEVELNVWTHTASAISLPGGGTIPANTSTATYDITAAVNIQSANITTSAIQTYDQVVVYGNRTGSVFTVAAGDNIVEDWDSADETIYNLGASSSPAYATFDDNEKHAANADSRARDKLQRVYSWWRIPANWDGKGHTPSEGVDSTSVAMWSLDSDGTPQLTTVGSYLVSGLRIENYLPMRAAADYSGSVSPDNDTDTQSEFIPPILIVGISEVLSSSESASASSSRGDIVRWVHGERLDAAVDSEAANRRHRWNITTRIQTDAPGLIFQTNNAPQHFFAADRFESQGPFEDIPAGEEINTENWYATIYVTHQQRMKSVYPAAASVASGDVKRTLEIQVDDAYLDRLIPGTVVDLSYINVPSESDGGWLRDDRERLDDIARLAWMWYGTERQTLNLSFKAITTGFTVGTLITELTTNAGTESINTAITSVSFDLTNGVTTLQTHYNELDFVGLVT